MWKKYKKILIPVLVILLLLLCVVAIQQGVAFYKRTLPDGTAQDGEEEWGIVITPPAGAQATATGGTCGHTGTMTILLLTTDASDQAWPGYASWPYGVDMIRYVRIDFDARTVRMIAVPRDLWVETPHLSEYNMTSNRLGMVFYNVAQGSTGSQEEKTTAAIHAVTQTLYDNFLVFPDQHLFFEMKYFAEAIDELGGVDIYNPKEIAFGGYYFGPGMIHLDGNTALTYARILPGIELTDGWDRFERQNIILNALREKVLLADNLAKIPGLVDQFRDDVITDMEPGLMTDLICMLSEVPQGQITLMEIDATMILGPGPDNSMLPDVETIRTFLQMQLAP